MSRSFQQASRLLKPADFKRVFDQAAVSSDHLFRVFARTGKTERSRLGIAVSRKVDRRAVVRNRIKRVVRESFRNTFPAASMNEDGGLRSSETTREVCDYVVVASPPSARADNRQLRDSLSRHWQKVGLKLEKKSP